MSHNRNPKPPYSPEFRQQIVELVAAGRKPKELASEFGCHETSVLSWMRKARLNQPAGSATAALALGTSDRQELIELRRKVRQLQMERDILSKATAWFASKSEPTLTASTR